MTRLCDNMVHVSFYLVLSNLGDSRVAEREAGQERGCESGMKVG